MVPAHRGRTVELHQQSNSVVERWFDHSIFCWPSILFERCTNNLNSGRVPVYVTDSGNSCGAGKNPNIPIAPWLTIHRHTLHQSLSKLPTTVVSSIVHSNTILSIPHVFSFTILLLEEWSNFLHDRRNWFAPRHVPRNMKNRP